jgi:hypothetical protein
MNHSICRCTTCFAFLTCAAAFSACDSEKSPSSTTANEASVAVASPKATSVAAPKQAAAKIGPAASTEMAAKTATNVASCPAGKWEFNYSDHTLQGLLENFSDAKLVTAEGKFVCDITAGQQGTMTCSSLTPIHNVISLSQSGMALTVDLKLSGRSSLQFTLLEGDTFRIESTDMSELNIDVNATIAGQKIPFEAKELVQLFGEEKSVTSYKCEGDNLLTKTGHDKDVWQKFTRQK